jgi:CheY-like chemotaxis protein
VSVEAPPGLPAALVDPSQLELAILNLAINARDAMPDGGRLSVELSVAEAGGLSVERLAPGQYLRVCVADTGVGMDAATLKRAVEPFFSTKGLGKGTGLGLSMVHGLAAQSGGMLRLSSSPGKGTRAELWLPVADEMAVVSEPAQIEAVHAARPATILVVDDEELVRVGTAEMLSDLGYCVIQAGSGGEALAILRSGTIEIDLLISDYLMPEMNGADVVCEARRLRPDLPVLLVTAYANVTQGPAAELPRLAKPFRQAELAARIADLAATTVLARAVASER